MKIYMLKLKSFSIAVMVLSMFAGTNVIAEVANTKHNLGSTGSGPNTYPNTAEICVFCHTPHGGDTSAAVPLWNRTLAAPVSYTTYDSLGSTSMDAAEAPVGSVSIACLSCHDGTQAMDTLINEPGSGTDVAGFSGGTWTGNDRPQGIANLSADLSNDHPIGIQYGGGGIDLNTPDPLATNDPDFVMPDNAVINSTTVWWVDTEGTPNGTREKTDMQLYTRTEATVGNIAQPFVECASCHDPHSEVVTFLRVPNTGSAVCLACHVK